MCENPKPVDWFRIFYAYYTGSRFSSRQSCCQVQPRWPSCKLAKRASSTRWDVLLAHNLLRSQMTKMAAGLKGYTANQLSFHMASVYLVHELSCMAYVLPGNIPG
jgi:hypothetical protein